MVSASSLLEYIGQGGVFEMEQAGIGVVVMLMVLIVAAIRGSR